MQQTHQRCDMLYRGRQSSSRRQNGSRNALNSSRRATKRSRSSMTELSFHSISTSRLPKQAKSVTHVSGTKCHPCLGSFNVVQCGDTGNRTYLRHGAQPWAEGGVEGTLLQIDITKIIVHKASDNLRNLVKSATPLSYRFASLVSDCTRSASSESYGRPSISRKS